MEAGIVGVNIEEYDQLRKLKQAVVAGNKIVITTNHYGTLDNQSVEYYTNDKIAVELSNHILKLECILEELKDPKGKEEGIEELRTMLYGDILKWRLKMPSNAHL